MDEKQFDSLLKVLTEISESLKWLATKDDSVFVETAEDLGKRMEKEIRKQRALANASPDDDEDVW